MSPGGVAAATAGLLAVTGASSSAALTGCHGAGMGGGIIALAGLGSATGAWLSEAATWVQFLLLGNLAVALFAPSGADRRHGGGAPRGPHRSPPDLRSGCRPPDPFPEEAVAPTTGRRDGRAPVAT